MASFTIVGRPGNNTMSLIQTNLSFKTRRDAELYIYRNVLPNSTKGGIPVYYTTEEAKEKETTSFTIVGQPGDNTMSLILTKHFFETRKEAEEFFRKCRYAFPNFTKGGIPIYYKVEEAKAKRQRA